VQADDVVIFLRTRATARYQPNRRPAAGHSSVKFRRTIAAVRQQLTDRQVDKVIICRATKCPIGPQFESVRRSQGGCHADRSGRAKNSAGPGVKRVCRRKSPRPISLQCSEWRSAKWNAGPTDGRLSRNVRKRVEGPARFRAAFTIPPPPGSPLAAVLWFCRPSLANKSPKPTRKLAELQIIKIRRTSSRKAETYKDYNRSSGDRRALDRHRMSIGSMSSKKPPSDSVRKPLAAKRLFPSLSDTVLTQLRIFQPEPASTRPAVD